MQLSMPGCTVDAADEAKLRQTLKEYGLVGWLPGKISWNLDFKGLEV